MRTHSQIIDDAGGHKALAEKLSAAGESLTPEQTRFWVLRKSIPADKWRAVERAGIANVDELLSYVEQKRAGAA